MTLKCFNTILAIGIFALVGLQCVVATGEPRDIPVEVKIRGFGRYLGSLLKQDILAQVTSQESTERITRLCNWERLPLVVKSSIPGGHVRARNEHDFLVIWYHSRVSLVSSSRTDLDVIRQGVDAVLSDVYAVGDDSTVRNPGSTEYPRHEIIMTLPKKIKGSNAVVGSDWSVRSNKRNWRHSIRKVSVLVKDRDAVIVIEKNRVRQGRDSFVYEGLIAAKARLNAQEAERAKGRPFLGMNVIFANDVDTSGISDRLLNGCIWPITNDIAVGVKDVGPVSGGDHSRRSSSIFTSTGSVSPVRGSSTRALRTS